MNGKGEIRKAVVLLSGGIDSTVLLHYVVKRLAYARIYTLSFSYGQKHERELAAARCQAGLFADVVEHEEAPLDVLNQLLKGRSSLLSSGDDVPRLDDLTVEEREQPPTYVPNRNLVLLSLAAAFAESRDCGEVFYGAQRQDEYGYWDCTPSFVSRLNETLCLNRHRPVRIEAPFMNKSKGACVQLGVELGVDFTYTWSCYRGGERPCGECPTCRERENAFKESGADDPLQKGE